MKKSVQMLIAAAIISLSTGVSHADPQMAPQYNKSQILGMIRSAHTQGEYRTLAGYFRSQQHQFEQKAAAEKQEWERRSGNVTGPAAKYPRPVDSSKNRYEYFTYKAQEMDKQAAHFENLSDGAR